MTLVEWNGLVHIVAHIAPGAYVNNFTRVLETALMCRPQHYLAHEPTPAPNEAPTCLWCAAGTRIR